MEDDQKHKFTLRKQNSKHKPNLRKKEKLERMRITRRWKAGNHNGFTREEPTKTRGAEDLNRGETGHR